MSFNITNPISSSSSSSNSQPIYSNLLKKDLLELEEKDLYSFFSSHNEIKESKLNGTTSSTKPLTKSTDFIHFIWMGNPLPEKYINNILTWKNYYPDKAIIIWVDQDSLKDFKLIDFTKTNGIMLIDIEKIFNKENTFDLYEIIKMEKNRLPTNWGAVSDIYRYLIMYYFAGTYSDTDEKITNKDTEINFNNYDMALPSKEFFFGNDRIMTKNIRQDFWLNVFDEIKNRYKTINDLTLEEKKEQVKDFKNKYEFKHNETLKKTGPSLLLDCIDDFEMFFYSDKLNIQYLKYKSVADYTWNPKLTYEKCELLMKEQNIEERIVANMIQDLRETGKLSFYKYFFREGLAKSKVECLKNPSKNPQTPPLLNDEQKKTIFKKLEQKLDEIDPNCELQYDITKRKDYEGNGFERFSSENRKNKISQG